MYREREQGREVKLTPNLAEGAGRRRINGSFASISTSKKQKRCVL